MGRRHTQPIPTSYEKAWSMMKHSKGEGRRRAVRGVRATVLEVGVSEAPGRPNIVLRYHATDVVTFMPDGSVVVDTGGWSTRTTQARINACGIPLWGLYSNHGFTLIGEGDPFVDGIVLGPAPDRQVLGVMDHRGAIQPYPPFVRYTAQCMVATRWYRQLPDPMKWRILIYAMSDDAQNPQSQFQSQPQPQLATA